MEPSEEASKAAQSVSEVASTAAQPADAAASKMGPDPDTTLSATAIERSTTSKINQGVSVHIDPRFSRDETEERSVHGSPSISIISLTDDSLPSKTRKPSFNFMAQRQKYLVIVDDVDYTPDNIVHPDYVTMQDSFTHAAYETKKKSQSELALKGRSKSAADMGMKVYATTIDLDDIRIDHTIDTEEGYPPEDADLNQAPSAFYLPKDMPLTKYPKDIFVNLKETETIHLYSLPTFCYEKGTPEGTAAEEESEYYQYITTGKGRNRKMVMEDTQTKMPLWQTRHTFAVRPKKKNQMTFASVWDIMDTYAELEAQKEEEEDDEMVMYQSASPHLLRKKRLRAKIKRRPETWEEISALPTLYDAALICERVLAANEYCAEQKIFRGLNTYDPLSPELVYIYSLKSLWTMETEETAGRPIASVSFNPKNSNILAVGHGKFTYAEKFNGIVNVWCTKNPCTPERTYRFDVPVTSLAFSERNPNWLAVAFSNGDVLILDIASFTTKVIAKSKRDTNPCFEPIWVTKWCGKDREEYVLTAGQDGRISRFTNTKTHDFLYAPMMRLCAVEGKMKGLEVAKQCSKADVPINRYPAALCLHWHQTIGHVYLVGTNEGCIHKCSTHYLNQHMDVFRAHSGPVFNMAYSPFLKTLLVSCGADNAIRLWIEGLDDVIMTLPCPAAVYDIAFCPINATILLSVSGNVLSVWDLRRKVHIPCAEYTFPGNLNLTYIKFSPSGDNIFVADTLGRVHTFHLEDTPIPPYYQKKMLEDAIRRALCTRPALLKQLEKIERFRDKHSN